MFWTKVKTVFSWVWDFMAPFVGTFATSAGKLVLSSALQAAVVIKDTYGEAANGDEKRKAAFNLIVDDLKSRGLTVGVEVGTSMVNAAIEVAVQKLAKSE
jgi:hypothetical protein